MQMLSPWSPRQRERTGDAAPGVRNETRQSVAGAAMGLAASGKPALAALIVLDVAVGLAGADLVEAEIELADIGVRAQSLDITLQHDAPVLHDVATVGYGQGHGGVLLDQKDGELLLLRQAADDGEDLLNQHRCEAQ